MHPVPRKTAQRSWDDSAPRAGGLIWTVRPLLSLLEQMRGAGRDAGVKQLQECCRTLNSLCVELGWSDLYRWIAQVEITVALGW